MSIELSLFICFIAMISYFLIIFKIQHLTRGEMRTFTLEQETDSAVSLTFFRVLSIIISHNESYGAMRS